MYKRINPKTELEFIVHSTIKEFELDIKKDNEEFKKYIYNIFSNMHRIDKLRFNFDIELKRIMKHQQQISPPIYDELDISNLIQQIEHIDNIPKHEQRSPEWYQFRRENITASSIGYICGKQNNRRYYEQVKDKCETVVKKLNNPAILHGVKYEQVATDIYERRNKVKVLEYGCLPHKYIDHLAASPDGICGYSSENPSYTGRMLEIKCPYSRQITGIIPEAYYYQIQVQLEVCDLNYCDFLECKIIDFPSFQELKEYMSTIVNESFIQDEYGVLLEYMLSDDKTKTQYLYSKIGLSENELEQWINRKIDNINEKDPDFILDKISYWTVEYSSVVLVKRDRKFFEAILPRIKTFWKDVEYYRQHPDELSEFLSSNRYKSEYENIDMLMNKKSDSESDKEKEIDTYLMIDSDDDNSKIIVETNRKVKKKKKSLTTIKEHFRESPTNIKNKGNNKGNNKGYNKGNNKKNKYKNISKFNECMLD